MGAVGQVEYLMKTLSYYIEETNNALLQHALKHPGILHVLTGLLSLIQSAHQYHASSTLHTVALL